MLTFGWQRGFGGFARQSGHAARQRVGSAGGVICPTAAARAMQCGVPYAAPLLLPAPLPAAAFPQVALRVPARQQHVRSD